MLRKLWRTTADHSQERGQEKRLAIVDHRASTVASVEGQFGTRPCFQEPFLFCSSRLCSSRSMIRLVPKSPRETLLTGLRGKTGRISLP